MSTSGTIAVKDKSGYIMGIYLHSDSYLENTGEILLEHYNTFEKATELISMGSCSVLYENIGDQHEFDDWEFFHEHHQCKFYHRDRGDKFEILKAKSEKSFYAKYSESNDYLFKDGKWYVKTFELNDDQYNYVLLPLQEALDTWRKEEDERQEEHKELLQKDEEHTKELAQKVFGDVGDTKLSSDVSKLSVWPKSIVKPKQQA